jgi:hypothetical protein
MALSSLHPDRWGAAMVISTTTALLSTRRAAVFLFDCIAMASSLSVIGDSW